MDELFRLPPGEFVARRDALAKELKAGGDKEGAAAVKALRRPSVGAWAVNQVAHDAPELVEAVIDAGNRVREAQEALLGGGDAAELRAATAERRTAISAAVKAAVKLAGAAHRDGIAGTFDAAAADADAAEAVRAGQLTKELDPPSGFEAFGLSLAAAPAPAKEPGQDDVAARREAEAAVAAAEATAAEAEAARDEAEAHRDEVLVQLGEAQAALAAAERAATEAGVALDEARAALAALP